MYLFACICVNLWVCITWRMLSTGLGVIGRYPIAPAWEVPLYKSEEKKVFCAGSFASDPVRPKMYQIWDVFHYPVRIDPWTRQTPRWRVLERRSSQTIPQYLLILVIQICIQKPSLWFPSMDLSWGRFCSFQLRNNTEVQCLRPKWA